MNEPSAEAARPSPEGPSPQGRRRRHPRPARGSSDDRARAAGMRAAAREAALAGLSIGYPEELPVSQRKDDIAAAIRDHQVVIVAGETGSGKTTQLPKICLELGRGAAGQIGHTQPRRIAARTVAERIAEELHTSLGEVVGYKVRFTDRSGDATAVKLMTDGILLAEIGTDRDLRRYDTLIIDEAHERSLNVDFILGYLRQLLPRRPDLKVIITSATIDPERFAGHFRDARTGEPAPIIEVSGRTYPVEVRYRPVSDPERPGGEDRDQVTAITDAIGELEREGPGDILVFLSGEQEIRDTADALRGRAGLEVLPLYSRLSSAEQHRVFEVPGSRSTGSGSLTSRRVVLATNVAETSLTVPGIRYVIDPGTARISRYSLRTKVQRLPIEPVSQASANQRKGRCGRVADGICIRLYSEEDFDSRPAFTDPEIQRTSLASVILQMAAARLGDVRQFPFVDPPDPRAITDGVKLLEELNAVVGGRLTDTGRQMARLPVDPRIARMIIESGKQGCAREILVIAAALSIQDPRERPSDNQQAADTAHRRFAQPESDFLAFVALWDYLAERQRELSGSAFRRLCRAEFLNYLRVREWQDLHGQLASLARDLGIDTRTSSSDRKLVHTALLAGLLSQVGMKVVLASARPGQGRPAPGGAERAGERGRRPLPEYLGARGTRFAIFPGSGLARKPPDWVVAAELVETSRLWARTAAAIDPEWVEPVAAHLVKRSYSEPRWSRSRGSAVATEKVTLYGIPVVADRTVLLHRIDPAAARELFIRHALVEGDWQTRHHFFRDNARLLEQAAELEQRARRRGLVAGEEALFAFYDARVPKEAVSARHFDTWWKSARRDTPDLLTLRLEDLVSDAAGGIDAGEFPEVWTSASAGLAGQGSGPGSGLSLSYAFEPGSEADGVTIDIPLKTLNQAHPAEFSWQVPGLRLELVTELIRSLPKTLRRELVPAPDVAREILAGLGGAAPRADVREVLSRELLRLRGVAVAPDDFDLTRLPPHLRITFRVTDGEKVVATGKDLAALQRQLRPKLRATLSARAAELTRTGVTAWNFGPLPTVFTDGEVRAYPALVDTGTAVDVRLFETAAAARQAMRAGTRRLVLLAVRNPASDVARRLTTAQKLVLSDNPHGSVAALFADCVSCAVDGLIADAGGPAWDADGFARLVEEVRPRLHAATVDVVTWAEEILRGVHEARLRLAGLRGDAVGPAAADIGAQLDGLIGPGFLTAAGHARLPALARYVKAVGRRLDKLPDNPGRDAQQMAVVHRVQDACASALAALPPEVRTSAAAQDIRWQVEELRVSLFAQTIGTPAPVSERRIMTAIGNLA
ncbi:MAG TPA: ATP-dependent RNA helicase HrpA [Trebonia sp.]|nr:ATP-dependent RNA helicase HrpA [Trebonia sp.]